MIRIIAAVLLIGLLFPAGGQAKPRAASFEPATLSIVATDGRERSITVRSARQLRNAIAPCSGRIRCEQISLETCDRCFMSAEAVRGGYLIQSRTGPPGPLYDLIDDRSGRQNTATFSLKDLTTILVDYLTDRKTIPLAWRDTGQI